MWVSGRRMVFIFTYMNEHIDMYIYLLLKGGYILGFVPLCLVLLQLISRTLFGFVTYHPFWPNGGSPSSGALWARSGELANLPTGHTHFVQLTQLEI